MSPGGIFAEWVVKAPGLLPAEQQKDSREQQLGDLSSPHNQSGDAPLAREPFTRRFDGWEAAGMTLGNLLEVEAVAEADVL